MFGSLVLRATYRGAKASGVGRNRTQKTAYQAASASRPTMLRAVLSGQVFKRSQRGLFDTSVPQSGFKIAESKSKTLRTWRPNVQKKTLFSETLGKKFSLTVTTSAMRTIRKYGGLDGYLQRRDGALLGELGRSLRDRLGATLRRRQLEAKKEQGTNTTA